MIRLKDIPIKLRINIVYNGVFVLILGAVGLYLIITQTKSAFIDTEREMIGQVNDLNTLVDVQIKEKQEHVNLSLNLALQYIESKGVLKQLPSEYEILATDQVSRKSYKVKVKEWKIGNQIVQGGTQIVDDIQNLSVETVTIFQKIDQGYLRIATNVLKEDGQRAVGTYIPNDSPVVETIESGEIYRGRAFVVNDWYRTAYYPLKIDGNIVGMLYVGVHEKDMKNLEHIFAEKKYFKSGYPFLIDKEGTFVVHPKREGDNVADEEFFTKMVNQKQNEGTVKYEWENENKVLYYTYSEGIESYICVSLYEEEFLAEIASDRNIILLAILIGLVLFVFSNIYIGNSITIPLKKSVDFAEKFAEGKLYVNVDIQQKDEVGKMVESLRKMRNSLIEIVKKIKASSEGIASISEQVSSSAQQIAEGASEQAASTEEVSSSMEEMAANINQTTENSRVAEQIALSANEKLTAVARAVKNTVESMRLIDEKISIIDDIAEKTDLLAVNAAIEAARAGASGKGFAVVAHEVRQLAENSSKASQEINIISDESVRVAEEAGRLMQELIPEIQNTSNLIQDITAASLEQNSGADQINGAVQQLTSTVQQNSAASEELAASANQMSNEAKHLKQVIAFLKTDEGADESIEELFAMMDKYNAQINGIKEKILHKQGKDIPEVRKANEFHDKKTEVNQPLPDKDKKQEHGAKIILESDDSEFEKF